ncbi:MAG: hypothetical protein HW387_571 [Parachlamydiales bacterium]|nr:hypothetical protein [Parachlamydiales bacterium]
MTMPTPAINPQILANQDVPGNKTSTPGNGTIALVSSIAIVMIVVSCLLFIPGAPLAAIGAVISGAAGSWLGMSEIAATLLIAGIATLLPSIAAVIAIAKRIWQPTAPTEAPSTNPSDETRLNFQPPDAALLESPSPVSIESIPSSPTENQPDVVLPPNEDHLPVPEAPRSEAQSAVAPQIFRAQEAATELNKLFQDQRLSPFSELLIKLMPPDILTLEKSENDSKINFCATFPAPHETTLSIPTPISSPIPIKLTLPQEILGTIDFSSRTETTITFTKQPTVQLVDKLPWTLKILVNRQIPKLIHLTPKQLTKLYIYQENGVPFLTAYIREQTAPPESPFLELPPCSRDKFEKQFEKIKNFEWKRLNPDSSLSIPPTKKLLPEPQYSTIKAHEQVRSEGQLSAVSESATFVGEQAKEKVQKLLTLLSMKQIIFPEFLFRKLIPPGLIKLEVSGDTKTPKFTATFKSPNIGTITEISRDGTVFKNIRLNMAQTISGTFDFSSSTERTITIDGQQLSGSFARDSMFWVSTRTPPQQLTKFVVHLNSTGKLTLTSHTNNVSALPNQPSDQTEWTDRDFMASFSSLYWGPQTPTASNES